MINYCETFSPRSKFCRLLAEIVNPVFVYVCDRGDDDKKAEYFNANFAVSSTILQASHIF